MIVLSKPLPPQREIAWQVKEIFLSRTIYSRGKCDILHSPILMNKKNFFKKKTEFTVTLLNPPPNLITLWSYFMTSFLIIKAISMKGAIPIQFQLWSYIIMTGILECVLSAWDRAKLRITRAEIFVSVIVYKCFIIIPVKPSHAY